MSSTLNSRRYELAVFNARGIDRVEKALLYALLPHVRWETGEARISFSALEIGTGWGRRALQFAVGRLEKRQILSFPLGRRGGRSDAGAGIVPVSRIDLERLEALGARGASFGGDKGAPGAPLDSNKGASGAPFQPNKGACGAPFDDDKGAHGADQGRTPGQTRAHPTTDKGARGAPNKTGKQYQREENTPASAGLDLGIVEQTLGAMGVEP